MRGPFLRSCGNAGVLVVAVLVTGTVMLAATGPVAAEGRSPRSTARVEAPLGAMQVPPGCLGGPPGPPIPGTRCPDGSVAGQPPAGCPGGPPGPAYPGTTCPDGSVPVPAAGPPGCQFGPSSSPVPGTVCPDGSTPRDRQADRVVQNILGLDDADEAHPLGAYDIGCDEGAWNAFLRKLWCGAQAMPFSWGKWTVGVGTDLMSWALEFRIAESLTPLAGVLSRVYDVSLVGPLALRHLAWTLALFACGWHLLRARLARGTAELASTFVIAVVGGLVVANPHGYLAGSVSLAKNASGAVLEAVQDTIQPGGPQAGPTATRERLGEVLRHSFVAEPYDLVNWGGPLTGECAAAREEILAGGPWGSEDRPREIMRAHGCNREADFNAQPSDSRAAASLIVALAAIAATVLLVAIALVVFVAQLTLVALFASASIVWALALFPGGRSLASWWLGRLVWAVAATVAATFVLSWLAITVTAALAASTGLSTIQRCLVALLIVAFGFRLRSMTGRAVEHASRRLGERAGHLGSADRSRWPGLAVGATGAAAGFGIAATAKSWAIDVPGGQYAYNRLYARHFTRGLRHHRGPLSTARRIVRHSNKALDVTLRTGARATRAATAVPVLGPAVTRVVSNTGGRATAASGRMRERLSGARAAHQQRAREAGDAVQQLLDAQREARESRRPASRPGRRPPPRAPGNRDQK